MPNRHRLLVALVLSGKDANEIDALRRALGSRARDRIPPHITLVPPLNVEENSLGEIADHLRAVAERFSPIRLSIGPPATFAPVTPVLYLEVRGPLIDLQAALSVGPLAGPPRANERPFVGHVTITNRTDETRIAASLIAMASFHLEVGLDRLTLFEQDQADASHPWYPIGDFAFGRPARVGGGGRALEFRISEILDRTVSRFVEDEWLAYLTDLGLDVPREDFAVIASDAGSPRAAALGHIEGPVLALCKLVVARAHRHEGIGSQLLRFVERFATERGCHSIEVLAPPNLVEFFAGFGYRPSASDTESSPAPAAQLLRREL